MPADTPSEIWSEGGRTEIGVVGAGVMGAEIALIAAQAGFRVMIRDLDAAVVVRRLHLAVEARITVEQAKGVLAARFAISPEVAFGRLVAAATLDERSLGDVATAVVERQTDERLDAALATPPPTDG